MPEAQLDPEQRVVATAPASSRRIVTAGPGSGKSHVVGERCRFLVAEEGLYPDEILALSFSNAAVDVVRSRTSDVTDAGQAVPVLTIDSLARRIVERGSDTSNLSFEAVIERATTTLEESSEPLLADVRHLVVDEIQDVVEVRARFLGALLAKGLDDSAGYTLLGDPLQGIYDFQATEQDPWTSQHLIDVVRQEQSTVQVELTGQYRSLRREAAVASGCRSAMLAGTPTQQMILARGAASELIPLGPLDEELAGTVRRWPGTTAFLCDTNARAALTSDLLIGLGLPNELQGSSNDQSLTPDIARVLVGHPSAKIDRETFCSRAHDRGVATGEELWRELTRATGSWRDLDIRELADALSSRRLPRELLRRPDSPVRVSTVHAAKGLEFDNVVLVDHDKWIFREDEGTEARVLFVALTRARSQLITASGCPLDRWRRDQCHAVWYQTGVRGRGTTAAVLKPSHVVSTRPVTEDDSGPMGQTVVWTPVDSVTDERGNELPCWSISVAGHEIARTTEDFGHYIRAITSEGRRPAIRGARVDGVMTVVGVPTVDRAGSNGLWLGGRVSGPIYFDWERR